MIVKRRIEIVHLIKTDSKNYGLFFDILANKNRQDKNMCA